MQFDLKLSCVLPQSQFVCCDTHARLHSSKQGLEATIGTNNSSQPSTARGLDGFLAIDKVDRYVVWYSKCGNRVIRTFSDSRKVLSTKFDQNGSQQFKSSHNDRSNGGNNNDIPLDAIHCELKSTSFIAILLSRKSIVFYKTKSFEYFELPLLRSASHLKMCTHGLILCCQGSEYVAMYDNKYVSIPICLNMCVFTHSLEFYDASTCIFIYIYTTMIFCCFSGM
jgi:hypothetical protein